MKQRRQKGALLVAIAMVVGWGVALAQEFSADLVSKVGDTTVEGKVFIGKDKTRTEMGQMITIGRADKGVAWMLMSEQKQYMEQTYKPETLASAAEKFPNESERKLLGNESVHGKITEKYRISYEANGTKQIILQWIDPASKIAVKTAAEDGSFSTEYRNIKTGPQPAGLFELPEGYTKFVMPAMTDMKAGAASGMCLPEDGAAGDEADQPAKESPLKKLGKPKIPKPW